MQKILLAGMVFVAILFLPVVQSWAGGYGLSPGVYFGVSWGTPVYNRVWAPGYWERRHDHRAWITGYRVNKHRYGYFYPSKKWVKGAHYRKWHKHNHCR